MPAQIRPNRIDVTDRYPMLAFTLLSPEGPRIAEVVLATDLALFTKPEGRNSGNFYSSREHGPLTIPPSGSVYTVPPSVMARFISAERLYFALATASAPSGQDWRVDVTPSEASPYISLRGLTDRALRRVRMFPTAVRTSAGSPAVTRWAGDLVPAQAPERAPAAATAPAPTSPAPAPHYNDGFGPLPPLRSESEPAGSATQAPPPPASPQPAPAPAATASSLAALRLSDEDAGIEGPVLDDAETAGAAGLAVSSPLTTPDYPGARLMPSPAYSSRRGCAIDQIVIHITGAPQSRYLGSHFTRPDANSSAHYMIDQNGAIIQFVREQDKAWHARSANSRSIGIEHVAIQRGGAHYGSRTYPYTPPTDVELDTSAQLVAHLCRKYGLTPDRTSIIGHREADPATTHTVCPDGAWDWDNYMTRVAAAYAATPAGGVAGATPVAQGLADNGDVDPESRGIEAGAYSAEVAPATASSLALSAAEYDRVSRIVPSPAFTAGRNGAAIDRIVIHITDAPTTSSTVNTFKAAGAQASSHYLVGQDGEIVQFVSEADTAWHAHGVNRRSIGIEHVAIKAGGVDYPKRGGGTVHYDALPPTDIQYSESAALVSHLCEKYGLPANRTTIVGHNEADPHTSHAPCPTGNWDWDHFMYLVTNQVCAPQATGQSVALGEGGAETVEIKYRAFIPSPALSGPFFDNYHGDGRGFSYSSGTSRGEITFLVDVADNGAISNLRYVDRHWSPSHSYSSSDTSAAPGKPDWWLNLSPGAVPTDTATCPTSDDTLRAYIGGCGTTANVLATVENASIASIAMSGNNPLVTGSPAIDADVSVLIRRTADGGIEVKAYGRHDGFPAHELYVNGRTLYTYDPVAAGNSPRALFPPEDIDADTGWQRVASRSGASAQSQARAMAGSERALDADDWSINWDEVQQIAQPTDMGCWATAAAMLIGWKERQSVDPTLLARFAGCEPSLEDGLSAKVKRDFAARVGLTVHPNACYTPEGFREILETEGPVWVTAKVVAPHRFIHAVVVTGMYRSNGDYFVRITDPLDRVVGSPGHPGARTSPPTHATGSRYIMGWDDFESEFEAAGDIDRIQLLHTNGAHGHTINRGDASGAGYALGLGERAPSPAPTPAATSSAMSRRTFSEDGRSYDLAQLEGMVRPPNALAGGAGMPATPGGQIRLDDWPYIEEAGARTQANVAIDWSFDGAAVGDIAIAPAGGSTANGRTVSVRADIVPGDGTDNKTVMLVRVVTTFSKEGEADQRAVTEVTLSGDGRRALTHRSEEEKAEAPASAPAASGAQQATREPVMA